MDVTRSIGGTRDDNSVYTSFNRDSSACAQFQAADRTGHRCCAAILGAALGQRSDRAVWRVFANSSSYAATALHQYRSRHLPRCLSNSPIPLQRLAKLDNFLAASPDFVLLQRSQQHPFFANTV